MPAVQALLPVQLATACNIDLIDARRIVSIAHRDRQLPTRSPATVRRAALDAVRAHTVLPTLDVVERRKSAHDPFVKYAFGLHDGLVIETVRIPLEQPGRYAVCVSSQVGCALACAFCATGRMGLVRNLETWEIVEQVRLLRQDLEDELGQRIRIRGVVFQGMGEPLANIERVIQSIRILCDPSAQAIDMRNITVCTAGLPAGIRRLAQDLPRVRLGVSLGSLRPRQRKHLMPIDQAHPLDEVLAAAGEHAQRTNLAPLWAYTLLAGHNDTPHDATLLAEHAHGFHQSYGIFPRISLIPYNSIGDDLFARSTNLKAFRDVLSAAHIGSIVRYSGGGDIGAACGQLVTNQASGVSRQASGRSQESD